VNCITLALDLVKYCEYQKFSAPRKAVAMFHHTESSPDIDTVPLHNAVLCVDCESVSASRHDECPVCGGHSLLVLARLLGGPLSAYRKEGNSEESVSFRVNIAITLSGMKAEEFSATVGGIASVLSPALGREAASFHIDVAPVVERRALEERTPVYEPKAA
jgi:hypothetical protein